MHLIDTKQVSSEARIGIERKSYECKSQQAIHGQIEPPFGSNSASFVPVRASSYYCSHHANLSKIFSATSFRPTIRTLTFTTRLVEFSRISTDEKTLGS